MKELEKGGEEPSKRAQELSQRLNKAWMIFNSEKKRLMDSGRMDRQFSHFHGKTAFDKTEREILGYMAEGDDAMRDLNRLMKARITQRNRDKANCHSNVCYGSGSIGYKNIVNVGNGESKNRYNTVCWAYITNETRQPHYCGYY